MILYKTERSRRRSVLLKVNRDLSVTVKAPLLMPDSAIRDFVERHEKWIERQKNRISSENRAESGLSDADILRLREKAREYFTERTLYWSGVTGLVPAGIKITSARTRFGSCSPKNSLCFSWRLMLYPEECADYVALHEICHISEKNHGPGFHALLDRYMPDNRQRERKLKSYCGEAE